MTSRHDLTHADVFASACSLVRHGHAEGLHALLVAHPDFLCVDPRCPPPPALHPDLVLADAVNSPNACHTTVAVLLRHGADPNGRNRLGHPIFDDALKKHGGDDLKLVEMLLAAGADPNWNSGDGTARTPLVTAITASRHEIVRRLLDAGADPNALSGGLPPLWYANLASRPAVVALLVAVGASPEYAAMLIPDLDLADIDRACRKPAAARASGGPRP